MPLYPLSCQIYRTRLRQAAINGCYKQCCFNSLIFLNPRTFIGALTLSAPAVPLINSIRLHSIRMTKVTKKFANDRKSICLLYYNVRHKRLSYLFGLFVMLLYICIHIYVYMSYVKASKIYVHIYKLSFLCVN